MKLALITCADLGEYAVQAGNEDQQLRDFLARQGLTVAFEVWNDPQVDWAAYDWLLLKSPWDYFNRVGEFYAWLVRAEQESWPLLNPPAVVRWNADKTYLRDLAAAGFCIIPSHWIAQDRTFEPEALFAELQTDRIIVKPRVGGGAKHTFAMTRAEAASHTGALNALFREEAFLAQPFMPEVQRQGEWSFVFFGGQYSHCVLKTARTGNFRVQQYLGGSVQVRPAPPHLLEQARRVVEKMAVSCLYARVDGLDVAGELWLMELELIEPFLFLSTHPEGYQNYYEAWRQLSGTASVSH